MDRSHRPRLVAFTGLAGSGKSTAARSLFPDYVRTSFAEPIRQMLLAGGLCTADQLVNRKEEIVEWLGVTPRRLMQTLGTEWGRDTICTDVWIRLCERRIRANLDRGVWVVVDDCRFNDEAAMIHRLGGVVIHIFREGVVDHTHHRSEDGLDRKYVDRIVYQPLSWSEKMFTDQVAELLYSFGGLPPSE